jgi:hypothetical protein
MTPIVSWAVAVSWIVFACHKLKAGGVIGWFLSAAFWQPLSKLCLSVYMLHLIYIIHYNYRHNPRSISFETLIRTGSSNVGTYFVVGFFFYILVEAPIGNLMNAVFDRSAEGKTEKEEKLPLLSG